MIVVRVVVVLAIALLAALLGTWIASDAGYVVVVFRGWEVSSSLWAALLALSLIAVGIYFCVKLVNLMLLRNIKIADWFSAKRSMSSQRQTLLAIEAESNGDTIEAIRLLVAAGQQSPNPILHFLRASELAKRIGAHEKAVELQTDAAKLGNKELQVFKRLSDALALLNQQDKRQGLRALRRLLEHHPRCAPALLELVRNCHDVGDWVGALEYLNVLSRLSFVADEEIYELFVTSWIGRIRQADPLSVGNVWHAVPRKLKHDPNVLTAYVAALREKGDVDKAIHELERSLSRQWDDHSILEYGRLEGNTKKQLERVQGWLIEHPENAALHLTVGRLHRQLGQMEEARRHVERSVSLGGDVEAKLELVELYVEVGDTQKVNDVMSSINRDLSSG